MSQSFQGKHIIWVSGPQKVHAHPVNYFPGSLGKIIENCPPNKLFLFSSLTVALTEYSQSTHKDTSAYSRHATTVPDVVYVLQAGKQSQLAIESISS